MDIPGVPKVPLGVYDFSPPEEVPGLTSMNVGGGIAAKGAKWVTDAFDSMVDLVDAFDGPL